MLLDKFHHHTPNHLDSGTHPTSVVLIRPSSPTSLMVVPLSKCSITPIQKLSHKLWTLFLITWLSMIRSILISSTLMRMYAKLDWSLFRDVSLLFSSTHTRLTLQEPHKLCTPSIHLVKVKLTLPQTILNLNQMKKLMRRSMMKCRINNQIKSLQLVSSTMRKLMVSLLSHQ